MEEIDKAIQDYNNPIAAKAFRVVLENLLSQAKTLKEQEPKSEQTRHWAVVYTELEKTLAYVKTYLGDSNA